MKTQNKITDQQKDNEGTLIIERYKSLKKMYRLDTIHNKDQDKDDRRSIEFDEKQIFV